LLWKQEKAVQILIVVPDMDSYSQEINYVEVAVRESHRNAQEYN
jgi:hypothetical protein